MKISPCSSIQFGNTMIQNERVVLLANATLTRPSGARTKVLLRSSRNVYANTTPNMDPTAIGAFPSGSPMANRAILKANKPIRSQEGRAHRICPCTRLLSPSQIQSGGCFPAKPPAPGSSLHFADANVGAANREPGEMHGAVQCCGKPTNSLPLTPATPNDRNP